MAVRQKKKAEEVQACVAKIKCSDVPALDVELWRKWDEVAKIVRHTGKRAEEVFLSLIENEYFSTLVEVVRAVEAEAGKESWARYPVTVGGVNEVAQLQRRRLLVATGPGERLAVEEALQKEWEETVASMSSYVAGAFAADAEEKFYETRYYSIM